MNDTKLSDYWNSCPCPCGCDEHCKCEDICVCECFCDDKDECDDCSCENTRKICGCQCQEMEN